MSISQWDPEGKQRKPLKRTPFKRKAPLPTTKARTPIKARSARRAELYRTERVPMIKEAMDRGQLCQVCQLIAEVDMAQAAKCRLRAQDLHERKTRGRGGSLTKAANLLWACRPGHDWITTHPLEAREVGLVLNSWDPDPVDE